MRNNESYADRPLNYNDPELEDQLRSKIWPVLYNLESLHNYLGPERKLFGIRPQQVLRYNTIQEQDGKVLTVAITSNSYDISLFPLNLPSLRAFSEGRISSKTYTSQTQRNLPLLLVGSIPQTRQVKNTISDPPQVPSATCLYATIPVDLHDLPLWQQNKRARAMAKIATAVEPFGLYLETRELEALHALDPTTDISQIYFGLLANPENPEEQEWRLWRKYTNGITLSVSLQRLEFIQARADLIATILATLNNFGDPLLQLVVETKTDQQDEALSKYLVHKLANPVFMPTTS